ncbi:MULTISPECIES: hypothetical protein [Loigolactobacillus]|uniref:Uncharacterized protein n=1 Tax=Loigolactobacillus backii TaxID=375175 RepID=A0A192GZG6_9LACO|nr:MULTISPECIES: hypothetical protein [Loigolactobacillus]ANK58853.1 hypothetical protein AYR52_00380 [Loigolactobacillus backii]ANK61485.1 hypothetical protein AYR53_01135 [Loigolactobacillus backii]ANK63843.1 hypothetical protein AYR54_00375 [Loigolactobacillus backii]ANK66291.1 hypothetical protein AYR55_00375 [Loigolactobacillus backii]ANK69316.1 hypothetical protein AYR56_03580 [Loigolactobacillus backii]
MSQQTDLQKHLQTIQNNEFDPKSIQHNTFRSCIHRSAQNLGFVKDNQLTKRGHEHLKIKLT